MMYVQVQIQSKRHLHSRVCSAVPCTIGIALACKSNTLAESEGRARGPGASTRRVRPSRGLCGGMFNRLGISQGRI